MSSRTKDRPAPQPRRGRPPARGPGSRQRGATARAVNRELFARKARLEEGTHEHRDVRNSLILRNMTLVRFAAKRYHDRADQMQDIVQVGTVGLIKAVDRFDLTFGNEFVMFAMPTIVGEMKRFFRDTSWAVHVPRRLQERRLDLARATDDLTTDLDHTPSTGELADRMEITEGEVVEAQVAAGGYTARTIDAPSADRTPDGTAWERQIGRDDPGFAGVDDLAALKPLLDRLPERERRVLSLRFAGDLTQAQIGAELGYSQMHISRILGDTLAALRRGMPAED